MDAREVAKMNTFCHTNEECPTEHSCFFLSQKEETPNILITIKAEGKSNPIVFLGHPSSLYYSSIKYIKKYETLMLL